jgi:hypothetical protein
LPNPKEGHVEGFVLRSSFKQQVVVDDCGGPDGLVLAELPALLLPFFDFLADVLVVADLYTRVFFQLGLPLGGLRHWFYISVFFMLCCLFPGFVFLLVHISNSVIYRGRSQPIYYVALYNMYLSTSRKQYNRTTQ